MLTIQAHTTATLSPRLLNLLTLVMSDLVNPAHREQASAVIQSRATTDAGNSSSSSDGRGAKNASTIDDVTCTLFWCKFPRIDYPGCHCAGMFYKPIQETRCILV